MAGESISSTDLEQRLANVLEHGVGSIKYENGYWHITNYAYNSSFVGKTLLEAIEEGEKALKATAEFYQNMNKHKKENTDGMA